MKNLLHSIRWRLIASYVLLTLLTVSLVGILALSLVKHYVEQREISYLTANAEAIAQQALPLMWPVKRNLRLDDLTHTSSFLGRVRVKILDKQKNLLSDSGPRADQGTYVFVAPVDELPLAVSGSQEGRRIALPGHREVIFFTDNERLNFTDVSGDSFTIIRRVDSIWGDRLIFEGLPVDIHSKPVFDVDEEIKIIEDGSQQSNLTSEIEPVRADYKVTVPIGNKNDPVGYVELSGGPNFGQEAVDTTRQAFLLAAAGTVIMALIVGLLVSRGLTAPLRSLMTATNQMSSGNLSVRAGVGGQGEIGQLGRQFNQMAERLETSFAELAAERDTLRRFIADASHELRTPITTLKNFNELLQGPAARDLAAQQEFLQESQSQLNRLEWITHNLLNLSRLEGGLAALDIAAHDAADILESVRAMFKPSIREKGLKVTLTAPSTPLTIDCDRTRVEMALHNLLDNAIKFSPTGADVELGTASGNQTVQFWVKDNGPGIDPADRPHLFDRFYRGKNSQEVTSSGLGLAIVQSVAQAHRGRVIVESAAGIGSRFVVELPLN